MLKGPYVVQINVKGCWPIVYVEKGPAVWLQDTILGGKHRGFNLRKERERGRGHIGKFCHYSCLHDTVVTYDGVHIIQSISDGRCSSWCKGLSGLPIYYDR